MVSILFQMTEWKRISKFFLSASMNEKEVLDTIKEVYIKHGVILDPSQRNRVWSLKQSKYRW